MSTSFYFNVLKWCLPIHRVSPNTPSLPETCIDPVHPPRIIQSLACCDKYRERGNALAIQLIVLEFIHPFHLLQPVLQHVQDPSLPIFPLFSAELQQNRFKKYLEFIQDFAQNKECKSCQDRNDHKMVLSKSYETPFAIFFFASSQTSRSNCKKRNIKEPQIFKLFWKQTKQYPIPDLAENNIRQ